jgi:hypothetical protein
VTYTVASNFVQHDTVSMIYSGVFPLQHRVHNVDPVPDRALSQLRNTPLWPAL